jgi:type I restriction enzyme, S subunit
VTTAAPVRGYDELTLADLLRDGVFVDGDWIESKDQDPAGDVRLIQLADVGDGFFRDRSARFLTRAKAEELRCTFLEPGDILIARMPEPLGRACVFPGVGQPAVTAVDVCIVRPNPKRVRSQWLVKAINSPVFRAAMQEFVRGTTRQRISRKNLGALTLTVPSMPEQIEVARLVDEFERQRREVAARLDTGDEAVKRFQQALLSVACSGRLTAEWRDENEPDRSADGLLTLARDRRRVEMGRRFTEPAINEHTSDAPLPATWAVAPLGLLLESVKYGTSHRSEYGSKGSPVLRIPNVSSGQLKLDDLKYATLDDREAEELALAPGDLLMIRSNGSPQLVGRTALVTRAAEGMTYAGYLMRLRVDSDVLAPRYLNLCLAGASVRAQIEMPLRSTSGVNNINTMELRALGIALPPIEEQLEITRRVDQMSELTAPLMARLRSARQVLDRSEHAVLAKVFRGSLTS